MANYTPLNISKKKGNFFLIANIFLLVVVVGITGVYLRNKLITTEEKAVAAGACQCASDSTGNNVGGCSCSGGGASCPSGSHVKNDRCGETSGGGQPGQQNNRQSCENSGGYWCDAVNDYQGNRIPAFCTAQGGNNSCGQTAINNGYTLQTGGGGPGEGGWRCIVGVNGYTSGPCTENNYAEVVGCRVPSCFCGIIQIDGCGSLHGTYQSTCGCGSNPTPPPGTGTPIPTPTTTLVTPTEGPTPTEAVTPTEAPTPTEVPTPTDVPPTETPTVTPTGTPGPTATPTPTGTPGPTATNTPTTVVSIPQAGKTTPFLFAIPIGIIILGLLL